MSTTDANVLTPKASPDGSIELANNRIRSLVHCWMGIWDRNDGNGEAFLSLLSPDGFEIGATNMPEPVKTVGALLPWFAGFAKKVKVTNHCVRSVNIEPKGGTKYKVFIEVACPGILATGGDFYAVSTHEWDVADYGGVFPRIEKIFIKLQEAT